MAKDYRKGDEYKLYYDSNGDFESPSWTEVVAADDIAVDPQMGDIEVPERGVHTGHLQGKGDMLFSFTLMEDEGSTEVEAMIAAMITDASWIHLAVSRGDITTSGNKYWHAECVLMGSLTANQGEVASYDVEAYRHANSEFDMERATVS